jgi:hypothetical protein
MLNHHSHHRYCYVSTHRDLTSATAAKLIDALAHGCHAVTELSLEPHYSNNAGPLVDRY